MSALQEFQNLIRREYADASNLNARVELHRRFGTNKLSWYRWVRDQLEFPCHARILEIGCGPGTLWRSNCGRIPSCWTIVLSDFSPAMLVEAKRSLQNAGQSLTYRRIDAQVMPFADGSFEGVIANHMLYHLPDVKEAIRQVRRILRHGGRFYAATNGIDNVAEVREMVRHVAPALPFTHNAHIARFSLENGEPLLQEFFAHVELRRYENALEITEAEPLVAYVLSTIGATRVFTREKVAKLRRIAQERIDAKGSIHVTLHTGMFVAIGGDVGENCRSELGRT
jgi:SAM-dependent methyltransferase